MEHVLEVCCEDTKESLPTTPFCGNLNSYSVSDNQTRIEEFPWTALLEVETGDDQSGYNCVGTLIHKRYVLTTARCITSLPPGWKVIRVRLGEWDQENENDCVDGTCDQNLLVVEIEKIVVHDDIALIRLTRVVEHSSSIQPICLPLSVFGHPRENATMYSAGWKTGSKKQKMELNIVDEENCTQILQRDGISLQSTQICTSAVQLNDTCSGDLGGPLMQQPNGWWYMYGMATLLNCGNNGVPDTYINVMQYVDWIKNNIY